MQLTLQDPGLPLLTDVLCAQQQGAVLRQPEPPRISGGCLEMVQPPTPRASFTCSCAENVVDLTSPGVDSDVVTKNKMVILELEEKYILAPGVVTVSDSGELRAHVRPEEPDQGTMAGLYPSLPPPSGLEHQIPSWLRDYLIEELNLFGRGPPSCCGSLYDQMKRSREEGNQGTNLTVSSAALLLSCATMSLRGSVDELRDFCSSGEAFCEETYAMDFRIVEGNVKRIAGCRAAAVTESRLLIADPSDDDDSDDDKIEYSPAKRRKMTKDKSFGVVEGDKAAPRELPRNIELLLDLGSRGMAMKGALDTSLEDLVITPVSRLVEKLETVAQGLRRQEEDDRKETEPGRTGGHGADHSSDSGISVCSP